MNIHVIPRRLHLTDPLCEFAAEKLGHLESINDSIVEADVVLSREANSRPDARYKARVRLAVPGRSVHATESAGDLFSALDLVQSKLARQLRKRKTRLNQRVTHRLQRRRELWKQFGFAY
jgi:putative sigma-54 modulation protein